MVYDRSVIRDLEFQVLVYHRWYIKSWFRDSLLTPSFRNDLNVPEQEPYEKQKFQLINRQKERDKER